MKKYLSIMIIFFVLTPAKSLCAADESGKQRLLRAAEEVSYMSWTMGVGRLKNALECSGSDSTKPTQKVVAFFPFGLDFDFVPDAEESERGASVRCSATATQATGQNYTFNGSRSANLGWMKARLEGWAKNFACQPDDPGRVAVGWFEFEVSMFDFAKGMPMATDVPLDFKSRKFYSNVYKQLCQREGIPKGSLVDCLCTDSNTLSDDEFSALCSNNGYWAEMGDIGDIKGTFSATRLDTGESFSIEEIVKGIIKGYKRDELIKKSARNLPPYLRFITVSDTAPVACIGGGFWYDPDKKVYTVEG
jgi:hypothetical protein